MAKLTVTVGLPCSGKSEYARTLAKETGAYLVSVSDIRREMAAIDPKVPEKSVFAEVHDKIRCCLAYGYDCILDGTYIKSSQRTYLFRDITSLMPGIPFEKCCVIVATPIERVFYNNIAKGSRLDNKIIGKNYRMWQTPAYWEGWNEIWVYYNNPSWIGMNGEYGTFADNHTNYDLGDKDYFDSLGGHCNSVHNHLLKLLQTKDPKGKDEVREKSLLAASLVHDCGKPTVEIRKDGKSLYYNHSNVGAYDSLFYEADENVDNVYASALITYHMHPYEWDEDNTSRAYALKKFGGEFVEDLSLLHKADEMAKESK